jgi:ABC-type transporter Mla subunit MlaD
MASRAEMRRNNIRTGLFVSLTLLLAVAIIMVLSGVRESFTPHQEYVVTYPIDDGIADLNAGSAVRVGGVPLGKVVEVEPVLEGDEPFSTIEVRFRLDKRVPLRADAVILVSGPLIGSDSWLEIPSVGTAGAGSAVGTRIVGRSAPGLLGSLLGTIGTDASQLVESVKIDYEAHIQPAIIDFRETNAEVRALVASVREEKWPGWSSSVDDILDEAGTASVTLNETLDGGKAFVGKANAVVDENRDRMTTTMENAVAVTERFKAAGENVEATSLAAKAAVERFNGETIRKANELLDRGKGAIDEAIIAITTMRREYEGWSVRVGDTLANATLASQQIKLAAAEIRRSPWKLLYRPQDQELEHELLYESTRSFAMAAADLKAASESVQRILDRHGDRLASDDVTLARISANLAESMDNYSHAQSQLFDILMAEEAP